MMYLNFAGQCFIIGSRISIMLLNVIACIHWICLFMVLHFLVMLGWIIEQRTSLNKREKMEWIYCFKMAGVYCICFSYLKNCNSIWRRRIWHSLIFIENLALIPLYLLNTYHDNLIRIISVVFVVLTSSVGILMIELLELKHSESAVENKEKPETCSTIEGQKDTERKDSSKLPNGDVEHGETHHVTNTNLMTIQTTNVVLRSKIAVDKPMKSNNTSPTSDNPSSLLKKRETMCSIQDLLANTSGVSVLYECDKENTENMSNNLSQSNDLKYCNASNPINNRSNTSINEVGLPIKEDSVILPCQTYPLESSVEHAPTELQNSMPKISPQSNLDMLKFKSSYLKSMSLNNSEELGGRETGDLLLKSDSNRNTCMNSLQINAINNSNNDYESIYNSVCNEENNVRTPLINSLLSHQVLTPKSLRFLQLIDQNITTQSLGSHDYENIPTLNVYRADTGVRHWKPYLDIESDIHDYSTYKERSAVQDSTLVSNLYANSILVTEMDSNRPLSMAERASSNYSVSLPDLSNIIYSSRMEVENGSNFNQLYHNAKESNCNDESKDGTMCADPPNYETIWYEDKTSSDRFTFNNNNNNPSLPSGIIVDKSGPLNNIYYSKISNLSSLHHFNPIMRRNNSVNTLVPTKSEVKYSEVLNSSKSNFQKQSNGTSKSEQRNEVLPNTFSTPNKKETRKMESRRTQRSPLMKLVSLSQNSLHEHTARAIQVGKKVFYRQRVHVITPKKELGDSSGIKITRGNSITRMKPKIDPGVLKKRGQLSPKNKLILSEASALIHNKQPIMECTKNLNLNHFNISDVKIFETRDTNTPDHLNNEPEDGPQHSTPENNRHLPQMSILSTISSVASPEESIKIEADLSACRLSASNIVRPVTGHLTVNVMRCHSKHLNEMSVIEEFESIPSQV